MYRVLCTCAPVSHRMLCAVHLCHTVCCVSVHLCHTMCHVQCACVLMSYHVPCACPLVSYHVVRTVCLCTRVIPCAVCCAPEPDGGAMPMGRPCCEFRAERPRQKAGLGTCGAGGGTPALHWKGSPSTWLRRLKADGPPEKPGSATPRSRRGCRLSLGAFCDWAHRARALESRLPARGPCIKVAGASALALAPVEAELTRVDCGLLHGLWEEGAPVLGSQRLSLLRCTTQGRSQRGAEVAGSEASGGGGAGTVSAGGGRPCVCVGEETLCSKHGAASSETALSWQRLRASEFPRISGVEAKSLLVCCRRFAWFSL